MDSRFTVDSNELTAHLARPARAPSVRPAVVVVHGFPTEAGGGINSTMTMPALADLIAAETGFAALTYASRGVAGPRATSRSTAGDAIWPEQSTS